MNIRIFKVCIWTEEIEGQLLDSYLHLKVNSSFKKKLHFPYLQLYSTRMQTHHITKQDATRTI